VKKNPFNFFYAKFHSKYFGLLWVELVAKPDVAYFSEADNVAEKAKSSLATTELSKEQAT